ncbi:DUF6907 domain-containing protein [Actinacidiphila sp. ITFR-21]|uniref:DUF6907 domain-containing protein n=1 Tax=Actinacidiphila sp. ITFR-21 TaxID=3075199 RepID=UPI0028897E65|nr:hypothetical protein [Streptomyces sp. ITFR-21]WNI16944.1 hypothetical protein RLT57_16370 [Streptomyces sp. ITFR-21]
MTTATKALRHFPWCAPGKCESRPETQSAEHYGQRLLLDAPDGMDMGPAYLLHAELYVDDRYKGTSLWLGTGDPDDDEAVLDGPQLDAFIARVTAFRDGLAAMRAQLDAKPTES